MLTTPAYAQAAEATKAAVDAGTVLLDRGVLGAACVLLALTSAVLLWLLLRSQDRYGTLLERVIVALEGAKDAADSERAALVELRAALNEGRAPLGELGRQIGILVEKVQHGFGNITASLDGFTRLVEREREERQRLIDRLQDRDRGGRP